MWVGSDGPLFSQDKPVATRTGLSQNPLKAFRCGFLDRFWKSFSESEGVDHISNIFRSRQTKPLRGFDNLLAFEDHFPRAALVVLREHVSDNLRIMSFGSHYFASTPGHRKTTTSSRSCSLVAVAKRVRNRSIEIIS